MLEPRLSSTSLLTIPTPPADNERVDGDKGKLGDIVLVNGPLLLATHNTSHRNWKMYFPRTRDDLLRTQTEAGAWHGDGVGDTYGTSIGLIVLQLPYANLPIFQR